jgi:hypothetical protein
MTELMGRSMPADDDDESPERQHLVEGRLAEDVEDVPLGQETSGWAERQRP